MRAGAQAHSCMLHPEKDFRIRWDLIVMVLMIYCAFAIPFRVGCRGGLPFTLKLAQPMPCIHPKNATPDTLFFTVPRSVL